ncbi:MAG: hypothetical protein D6E12_17010 [Desulfovibrio sp.]|nr:MAG: hypothetical protein D6E12_17010 [Desulfovibrio sp.]
MRLSHITTLAALFIFALAPLDGLAQEPRGFRGLEWGNSAQGVQGLTLIEQGDSYFYVREGEILRVGEAELTNIIYGYFQDRFYTVVVEFDGFANFTMILYALETKYGRAANADMQNFQHYWFFDTVDIYIEYDPDTSAGNVFYVYTPIMEERERGGAEAPGAGEYDGI